jgi:DNA polymerase I
VELKFDPKDPKYEYITDAKRLDEVLDLLSKERAVGVDVETTGFDAYTEMLLTVQLGTPEISYIVDARKIDLKKVPKFKELLENTKIIKILQNGKFDYKFIKHQAGAEICNIYDTMLAEGVLMAGLGSGFYGLQGLVSKYLGFELSKEARSSFQGMKHRKFTDEQLKYGALDTLVLFPIFEKQIVALKKEKIFDIAKLEFAATRVVAEMEYRGIFIDVPRWKTIVLDLREKRDKHAIKFYNAISPYYAAAMSKDLFGDRIPPININSQVQLMDLFNNKLGLDIPSTGDAVLAIIDHEIAVILREYRKYEKLISAFGDSLLEKVNSVTGRLHPSFNQLGAATGRFSCRDPNLQQIPRNSEEAPFRECFNPQPGYKLVTTDYGSFEMRVLAELSNDDKFIHALKEGLDVHSYTAALMFGLEYTDDFKKKYPEKRQAAKAINFGLMYGMGPGSLARQIDVSKDEAVGMMNKYFESYPKVKKFLNKMATNAVRNGWSSTPGGRKRWYKKPDESDPDYKKKIGSIQRQAKNHPIQGTNADAVKYALVFLHDRMKKEGIDGGVTHTVHDEVVCEVPNEVAEKWADIQSEEMIRAAKIFLKNVPVTSDPFVGDVWEH